MQNITAFLIFWLQIEAVFFPAAAGGFQPLNQGRECSRIHRACGHGTDNSTTHATDTACRIRLIWCISRNCTDWTASGAESTLNTVLIGGRVHGSSVMRKVGKVAGQRGHRMIRMRKYLLNFDCKLMKLYGVGESGLPVPN